MKKILLVLPVVCFLFFIPNNSFAWGRKGHSIVVQIAFHFLDEQTKANVIKCLNGKSIEDAASWMDDMRSDHSYDYLKPYHYLDAEKGEELKEINTGNIVSVLNETIQSLSHLEKLSGEDLQHKLFFLFHLTGDIHQPLHVGYASDKGGNKVQVSFFGKGSNIHTVWDTEIIEYKNIAPVDCLKQFNYSSEKLQKIQKINVLEWGNESRKLLDGVYSFKNNKIDEEYITAQVPIIEKQLLLAGLRLAAVLQQDFRESNNNISFQKQISGDTPTVDVNGIEKYEGQIVRVCTKIFSTKYLETAKSKPTLLNAGAAYPNSPLTIFIRNEDRNNFKNKPEDVYSDKDVCVTGRVTIYKGKPEIIISHETEIQIK